MSSVFLSHAHSDKPFARKLAADLRLAGHNVWIDEAEIKIGDSLIEKIRDGIDQVDFVAAVISSASAKSKWVTRELDIASNREIKENRVVVLPLLVERVPLPGFLEGKLYGDFCDASSYEASLKALLKALGPAMKLSRPAPDEIKRLRKELAEAESALKRHEATARGHEALALRGKSKKLVEAIREANKKFPQHAPINNTYAFEVADMPVTLDYLLWAIAKAEHRGGHPLEILISIEEKWADAKAMINAYSDLVNAAGATTSVKRSTKGKSAVFKRRSRGAKRNR